MLNFEYQNPTRILFGKGSITKLGKEILKHGKKPLLVYGGQSLKESGNYDKIISVLKSNDIDWTEFGGVRIPSLDNLNKGIAIAKEHQVDMVIGIGGGCCIDMAKSIAIGAINDIDIWDVLTKKVAWDELDVLPIGSIVTVAGSGSEMDGNSEIDDLETNEHGSIGSFIKTYPTFSILDTELTYSCPWNVTAYHAMTIVTQAMEQYLIDVPGASIQNGFVETICKTVLDSLRVLKENLQDDDARGNLLWASALACNRLLGRGKNGPWLGGPLGGLVEETLDLPYTRGIALTWPKYLLVSYMDHLQTMKSFAIHVMNVNPTNKTDEEIAYEGAYLLQEFYKEMGLANTIQDLGLGHHEIQEFQNKMNTLANRDAISIEEITQIMTFVLGGE